jgi:ribonuclease BN (tRNA processing enzyme)
MLPRRAFDMEVTILGSGTAVPDPSRFPSGVLVVHEETVVVIDMGPGVLRRLSQAGYHPGQITTVLLTHFHTDHTADLAALLFALRNPSFAGRPPLTLMGSPGLKQLLDHLTSAWPWLSPKGYPLEILEIGPGSFSIDQIQVTAVPIRHTAASLAYRLTGPEGSSVALSGDADVCDGLAEAARDTDLFICEAAFPDGGYVEGHLTPSLAGTAAETAGTRKLCLTHFYPECAGHDLLAQARTTYSGDVVLAEDLMQFEL